MPREINFLSDRRKEIVKQEVADKKITVIGSVVLGICFAIFLAFSGVQFYYSYQLTQIKAHQESLRQQIVGNQDTEKSFVIFVRKLSNLVQIDQERQDKKAIIQFFNSYFGSNVSIVGVEFDQKQKLLTLQLQSTSVFSLKDVLTKLNDQEILTKFSSISPSNLGRTPDGKYQLDVTVSTVASKL